MSGYLQRMALSVLKPEVAVHPVVGSIFSAPRPRDSFESIVEVENVASNRGEVPRDASSTAANSSASSMGDARETPPETNVARSMRPAAITPSIDTSSDRLSRPSDTARSASVDPGQSVTGDRRTNLPERIAAKNANPANPANAMTRRFTPLMPTILAPSPQPVIARSPATPTNDAARTFAARSRANDDIEIHIGRIEVAAIQAAPTRSAPAKPPRRAASLDEYLKRRDGIV